MQRLLPRRKKRRAEIPHPSSSEAPIPIRSNPKIYTNLKRKKKQERIGVAKGMTRKSERPIRIGLPRHMQSTEA